MENWLHFHQSNVQKFQQVLFLKLQNAGAQNNSNDRVDELLQVVPLWGQNPTEKKILEEGRAYELSR